MSLRIIGKNSHTITSGIEGAWKPNPTKWDNGYFDMLFKYEWELVKSPAGAHQWQAINVDEKDMIPDAHDSKKKHRPMMTTADLALRFDPIYSNISKRFHGDPTSFADTFARAWFKLTHRDMGPIARYLGPEVPKEHLIWQDPLPDTKAQQLSEGDLAALKKMILNSGLSVAQLVTTAWCSASTFRVSDLRGGANGARLRLLPQKDWEVNHPAELTKVIETLEGIQLDFNRKLKMNTSLADTIVLAGCVGVQKAAKDAGYEVEVPVAVGRVDTTQELTDADSFGLLEPIADGFRNYARKGTGKHGPELLVDRAHLLSLTAPEMTLLIGGMRVLGTNFGDSKHGVFTSNRGSLTNDFFINVLDAGTQWKPSSQDGVYDVVNRATGKLMWTATGVDLVFGSNSQLRAIADVYAQRGNEFKFVADFIAAWDKVMNLDRYDLK